MEPAVLLSTRWLLTGTSWNSAALISLFLIYLSDFHCIHLRYVQPLLQNSGARCSCSLSGYYTAIISPFFSQHCTRTVCDEMFISRDISSESTDSFLMDRRSQPTWKMSEDFNKACSTEMQCKHIGLCQSIKL